MMSKSKKKLKTKNQKTKNQNQKLKVKNPTGIVFVCMYVLYFRWYNIVNDTMLYVMVTISIHSSTIYF
jgi:hypothetical protein